MNGFRINERTDQMRIAHQQSNQQNSTRFISKFTLVIEAAHAQVDGRSRHPARLIGRHEDRHVCHLRERHKPSRVGPACEVLLPLFPGHARCLGARLEGFLDRACLQHGLWPQADHANALRCELGGEISSEGLLSGLRRTVASHHWEARPRVERGDGHDHPRFLRDHVPCGQTCGQEVRRSVGQDRQGEAFNWKVSEQYPLLLFLGNSDCVERDIDAARLTDHGLQMPVHSLLVESVDLRRLGGSAGGNDVLSDRFDGRKGASGEKDLGSLRSKGACDSTSYRTSSSVDYRNLVLQYHLWFLSVPGCQFLSQWIFQY